MLTADDRGSYRPSHFPSFVEAGADITIVHGRDPGHPPLIRYALDRSATFGASPAVALNPHTPLETVASVIDLVDMVLIMTVNPGFGGQTYISTMEPKIDATRRLLDTADHWIDLEVDGGISSLTVGGAAAAGANVLISGSALFKHPDGLSAATSELRDLATMAWEARLS
ncbi:UNVERIFIED_CONTAM: hypothetical protein GTU68_060016 [Idotea baltica]|nr:hypothetical protein [Idotea baltica]